jgi:hypothetical protein
MGLSVGRLRCYQRSSSFHAENFSSPAYRKPTGIPARNSQLFTAGFALECISSGLMVRSSFEFAFFKSRGSAFGYVAHILLGVL